MTPNEKQVNPVWAMFKKTWYIWYLILSVSLGTGILSIPSVKLVVSDQYLGYFAFSIVTFWSLTMLTTLARQNKKMQEEVVRLKEKVESIQENIYPSLFIENIAVSSLMAHVELRKQRNQRNPVQLDEYEIDCIVDGSETLRKDAEVRYYLKGKNVSNRHLTGLHISIAGENLVPFETLMTKVYNLQTDKERCNPVKAKLIGPDSIRKDLLIPFVSPGVEPFSTFEIELNYRWPRIFSTTKDYWFIDNFDFEEPTKQLCMRLKCDCMRLDSVRVYSVDMISKTPVFLGALAPEQNDPTSFVFRKYNPEKETYYLLLFDCACS